MSESKGYVRLVKALALADDELSFTADNGARLPLSRTIEDMGAFIKTDDTVFSKVLSMGLTSFSCTSPQIPTCRRSWMTSNDAAYHR